MTARWLRDLLLWSEPRSWPRASGYLVLAVMLVLAAKPSAFSADYPVTLDGHALSSMSSAISYAYCGRPFHISTRFYVPVAIIDDDSLRHVPLPDAIARLSGSVAEYCTSIHGQANNENSLMLLEAAVMKLWPRVSVAQVGGVMHGLRVAAILLFALVLLVIGASVAMAAATVAVSLGLLDAIRAFFYTNYPFLAVMVIASAALHAVAFRHRWASTVRGCLLVGVGAGLLAACGANIRTSYTPILLAHFAYFVGAELLVGWRGPRRWLRPSCLVVCYATAFGLFQVVLIDRHFPDESLQVRHHSVAHPLVLALSTPENDLSRELNIEWLDSVGAEKALSVDPQATFLGPRYDAALFTYYRSLWANRPWQMLQVYALKFATVGPDMIADLRLRPWLIDFGISQLLAPASWIANGWWLLAVYSVITLIAIVRFLRRRSSVAFLVALLGTAAVLLQTEAGLIYSQWVPQYHAYLAFSVLFVSHAGTQLLINAAVALALRVRDSPRFGFVWVEGLRLLGLDHDGVPRRLRRVVLHAALVALSVTVTVPAAWMTLERAPTTDRTAAAGVEAAVRWTLCGSRSSGLSTVRAAEAAVLDDGLRLTPIRAMVMERAGSIEAFCAGAAEPDPISVPMLALHAAALTTRPQISAAGLGKFEHYTRVAMVAIIAGAMIWLGFSPALVYGATMVQLWVLVVLREHLFSSVPFVPVLALATILMFVAVRTRAWMLASPAGTAALGAWGGACAAVSPALALVQWLCCVIAWITVALPVDMRTRVLAAAAYAGTFLVVATVLATQWSSAFAPAAYSSLALLAGPLLALQTGQVLLRAVSRP